MSAATIIPFPGVARGEETLQAKPMSVARTIRAGMRDSAMAWRMMRASGYAASAEAMLRAAMRQRNIALELERTSR